MMKHYRRHRLLFAVLRTFAGPFIRGAMRYRHDKPLKPNEPSIIIANHNCDLDPALVALGISSHIYFVASEHTLRKGFFSALLKFVFAPIPINKTHMDASALKEILRRLKAGFHVCLFAEGNRSYNGVTGPIPPATAKLAKLSGAALITFRLEGGYLTTPRWAQNRRRGRMEGHVAGQYPAARLKAMTNDEVLRVIERDIHEDAYKRQKDNPIRYRGKNLAEHIETALYLCPECLRIGSLRSEGDRFSCVCGLNGAYTETGALEGRLPFFTVADWDRWQSEELARLVEKAGDRVICSDPGQQLFLVHKTKGTQQVAEGTMAISREKLTCAGMTFPLDQITRLAVVGKMTLLFSLTDLTQYEARSAYPRSALKYLEICRAARGERKGR